MPPRKISKIRLTRLQEQRKREKGQRDERVRFLRKYPLCVSADFMEYAELHGWNDRMVDAAALIMHRYFMGRYHHRLQDDGWLPIPYQTFQAMFGDKYIIIRNQLEKDGFLEFDKQRGYRAGSHCSRFRPRQELRDSTVSASYRIQSNEMQEIFIRFKKRFLITKNNRRKSAAKIVKIAFSSKSDLTNSDEKWGKDNFIRSYYHHVQNGYLTEIEFSAIKQLTENAFQLELRATEDEIRAIATKQYENPTRKGKKRRNDLSALQQIYIEMAERTTLPSVTVKNNGRYYTPFTNLPTSLWNHVIHDNQPLASIDVKTSHVFCVLAFIKDIGENYYFGNDGTHEERLSKCRFSRQISIIPGLVDHLHRSAVLHHNFHGSAYRGSSSRKIDTHRIKTFRLFKRFTIRCITSNQYLTELFQQQPYYLRYLRTHILISSTNNNTSTSTTPSSLRLWILILI